MKIKFWKALIRFKISFKSDILGVVKRNPLFLHEIEWKNNGFLFTTPNIKSLLTVHEYALIKYALINCEKTILCLWKRNFVYNKNKCDRCDMPIGIIRKGSVISNKFRSTAGRQIHSYRIVVPLESATTCVQ